MPTIEITPEQAAALAAGESITLAPPEPASDVTHIAIAKRSGCIKLIHNGKWETPLWDEDFLRPEAVTVVHTGRADPNFVIGAGVGDPQPVGVRVPRKTQVLRPSMWWIWKVPAR